MSSINAIPIPTLVSITMLLMAMLGSWPYGFYVLLRLVVCLTSIFNASFAYKKKQKQWMYTMGFIALLFNPIIKIHFDKSTWQLIDLVTAIILAFSVFKLKKLY